MFVFHYACEIRECPVGQDNQALQPREGFATGSRDYPVRAPREGAVGASRMPGRSARWCRPSVPAIRWCGSKPGKHLQADPRRPAFHGQIDVRAGLAQRGVERIVRGDFASRLAAAAVTGHRSCTLVRARASMLAAQASSRCALRAASCNRRSWPHNKPPAAPSCRAAPGSCTRSTP